MRTDPMKVYDADSVRARISAWTYVTVNGTEAPRLVHAFLRSHSAQTIYQLSIDDAWQWPEGVTQEVAIEAVEWVRESYSLIASLPGVLTQHAGNSTILQDASVASM